MKFLVAVFAILAVVNADWTPKNADEIKAIRAECLKLHPLTPEQFQKMKNFEFPNEAGVRKYLECTADKLGIFCSVEGYHADRIAKQFKMDMEESEVLAIAEGCIDKNEQGSTSDVWAFRGHKCLMSSAIGDKVKAYIKKRKEEAQKNTV